MISMTYANYAIIILAAGQASRMGEPKQLLVYHGKTLLEHIYNKAMHIEGSNVVVVLGAHQEAILQASPFLGPNWVFNPHWSTGMGSSIRCGMEAALKVNSNLAGVLIVLVDQPFVETNTMIKLLDWHKEGKAPIICARYGQFLGVPAVFGEAFFPILRHLNDEVGARKVIRQNQAQVVALDFAGGLQDLDTPQDWQRWLMHLKKEQK